MGIALTSERVPTAESEAHYHLAIEKINRSNFKEAHQHLVEALRVAPMNPVYLSYYGLCLANVGGDYKSAIRACRQAAKAMPRDPVIRVNLGRVYRLKGDIGSAHREFLTAHRLDKQHPAPAAELTRMGVRRPPVIPFLPRSNWCNRYLGRLRAAIFRRFSGNVGG